MDKEKQEKAQDTGEMHPSKREEETGRPDHEEQDIILSRAEYEELEKIRQERDDYLERLRRAVADNMNLQNRIEKVRERAGTEALRELARKVVPLSDSLERALENAEKSTDCEPICEGLKLTIREFYEILKDLDIEPIEAKGRPFDPDYHDAVYQRESEDHEPNTVLDETKKGFLISGQLLRPSQVVVAAPLSEPDRNQPGLPDINESDDNEDADE